MFNNLLESKPKKEKRGGGTVTSVIVHSILVGLAVYATANAAIRNEKPKQEKIDFVETPKDQPPPKEEPPPPPPPDVVVAPPPPKGFQVLTAPVEIPDVIRDNDFVGVYCLDGDAPVVPPDLRGFPLYRPLFRVGKIYLRDASKYDAIGP